MTTSNLPHSIYYSRVQLKEGKNEISLVTNARRASAKQQFVFEGEKGKTIFQTYQSIESNVAF